MDGLVRESKKDKVGLGNSIKEKILADQEKLEFCLELRALIDATLPVSLP